jgi:peptide deformylase
MLEFVQETHPILSAQLPPVDPSINLEALSKDMFMLMWSNGGIGLAAPQVGIAVRMFVMGPQKGPNYVCVNPEIVEVSEKVETATEGCLSFPSLWLNIKRPTWVHARYTTLSGETVEQKFDGLLARCYIHELEHLDGITFTKYSSQLGLKLARARQVKSLRKQKRVL